MKTILMLIVGLMLTGCESMENHVRNVPPIVRDRGDTIAVNVPIVRDRGDTIAVNVICACP